MNHICLMFTSSVMLVISSFMNPALSQDPSKPSRITITVLYDNTASDQRFKADWGFSCFIEGLGKNILFDAGTRPEIFSQNLIQAQCDHDQIDHIVISHLHGDHTGGLASVINGKNLEKIFLPETPGLNLAKQLDDARVKSVVVRSPMEITPQVHLTGPLGTTIIEQSLVIDTPKGPIIMTGCSHPDIILILQKAVQLLKKNPYLVLGGFHLMNHSEEQVNTIIASFQSLNVQYCGATHCTGEKVINAFRKAYGNRFIEMGAGRKVIIDRDGTIH